jgi:hypothetical protein
MFPSTKDASEVIRQLATRVLSSAIQVSKLFQRMRGSKADKATKCTPTNSVILAII